MAGGNTFFGRKKIGKGRQAPDCEDLSVIILHAIFYFIIGLLYQVSVLIEENTKIMAL